MRNKCIVALAVAVGFGLGAIVVGNLHAQAKAPVYLIEEIEVTNPEAYGKEFIPKIQAANRAAGVRALAAGGKITPIDGTAPKGRVVVQVWDSVEKIQAY